MKTLSLVIPAYNEEERLPALLDVLSSSARAAVAEAGFELAEAVVVDDGSSDGTAEILQRAAREQKGLKALLDFGENRGKGAAIAAGVSAAKGEYVLFADVDLSTPLGELGVLGEAMRAGADVVIGSRNVEGATVERGPAHRKLTGGAFNHVVRLLTGLKVRDTQNGFKLLPTGIARELFAEQLCPGFAFDVEMLMRADIRGLRIAEVPVLYLHDSRSSVRVVSASFRMLREVSILAYKLRVRDRTRRGASRTLAELSADDSD